MKRLGIWASPLKPPKGAACLSVVYSVGVVRKGVFGVTEYSAVLYCSSVVLCIVAQSRLEQQSVVCYTIT